MISSLGLHSPRADTTAPGQVEAHYRRVGASVVGLMLVGPGKHLEIATDSLRPKDFLYQRERLVFEAIVDLCDEGVDVVLETVRGQLLARKQLELIGGMEGLFELQGIGLIDTILH